MKSSFFFRSLGKSILLGLLLSTIIGVIAFPVNRFIRQLPNTDSPSQSVWKSSLVPTVILDAGHGGSDPGAISIFGDEEKHINLVMVQKIGSFLENSGIRVLYTRTEDHMLSSEKTDSSKMGDLMARVDFSKDHPDAVFISIHMNTLSLEQYSGLQVFYDERNTNGKILALLMQNDVHNILQPNNNRSAKAAEGSIYILDRITAPAVLVECGFLSNKEEAHLLMQEDYRDKLAFTISRSIISFVSQKREFT